MSKGSFEGLGEPYFDDWFRRYPYEGGDKVFAAGTLRSLDYVISSEMVVLELEDTVLEVYNAIRQILMVMPIVRDIGLGVAIVIPFPSRIEPLLVPLAKYF